MEKLSKTTILQALNAHKAELKQFGVKKIALFGSFLHDSAGKQSDIDIYVELESPSFDTYFDLKFFLEKLLGRKRWNKNRNRCPRIIHSRSSSC